MGLQLGDTHSQGARALANERMKQTERAEVGWPAIEVRSADQRHCRALFILSAGWTDSWSNISGL